MYNSLERDALRQQRYHEDEIVALLEGFDLGENPDGRFVFHWTKPEFAQGILANGFWPDHPEWGEGFRRGRWGWCGYGVYFMTIPNPNPILKLLTVGRPNRPVRLAVDRNRTPFEIAYSWVLIYPLWTVCCPLKPNERLVLGQGVR